MLLAVAAACGPGISWVANRQLPVFDWHYLFGYSTVLLVTIHLCFNLPLALRGWHPAQRSAVGIPGAANRVAAKDALAAAFFLGTRERATSPLLLSMPSSTAPAATSSAAVVLVLSAERDAMLAEGTRGYRHGFLEAGMIGVDYRRQWVLHFAALGVPAG